ncbi:MAG: Murein DD-endopeptidase MepM and murein hydrolase activator NlpD, containing LysM domain [Acidimicrobiales bacterium]|nr:Murein DD-endopeptidase MepM and murein hydrolase activator NlpD, containing LysM domain [Acidimicrobiales bacterium]
MVVTAGLLAAALAAPTLSWASPDRPRQAAPEEDTSLKGEYDEVIGQEARLVEAYQAAQLQRMSLARDLDRLRTELRSTQVDLLTAHAALDKALATEKRQVAARRAADRRVAAGEERLRQQIVDAYVHGGQDTTVLEALLNAETGEEAGQAVAYSRAAVGDTDALVRQLEQDRTARKRAERAAKRARGTAKARRDEIQQAATFIDAATGRQERLVAEMDGQLLLEQAALRQVQARKAIIEGRINTINQSSGGIGLLLARVQAGQPDWAPGEVEITNPIPGYRIGSKFGMRFHPILHISRLHAGGDMGAPSGTPIYAPADGIVVIAGVHSGYGNTTVIDHGHSLATLYGHQSRMDVRVGQFVKRGDVIGLVGSTGMSTGPHLHFETRIKGNPIDPEGVVDFSRPDGSYAEEARKKAEAEAGN